MEQLNSGKDKVLRAQAGSVIMCPGALSLFNEDGSVRETIPAGEFHGTLKYDVFYGNIKCTVLRSIDNKAYSVDTCLLSFIPDAFITFYADENGKTKHIISRGTDALERNIADIVTVMLKSVTTLYRGDQLNVLADIELSRDEVGDCSMADPLVLVKIDEVTIDSPKESSASDTDVSTEQDKDLSELKDDSSTIEPTESADTHTTIDTNKVVDIQGKAIDEDVYDYDERTKWYPPKIEKNVIKMMTRYGETIIGEVR